MRALTAFLLLLSGCGKETRFSLAGIDRPGDARRFLNELKDAADTADLETLVGRIRFPFTTFGKERDRREYATRANLPPDLTDIFTPPVLRAIQEQSFDSLFVNYQGVMIGQGEVWFDGFDGEIRIKAVNSWSADWVAPRLQTPDSE